MNKKNKATILVILIVIVIAILIISRPDSKSDEKLAKCIGEKSELYTKLGCHACKIQEDMFGEDYQYLTVTDCFYEMDICVKKEITATPTWIINGEKYIGVQTIEKLKELTGC